MHTLCEAVCYALGIQTEIGKCIPAPDEALSLLVRGQLDGQINTM